MMDVSRADSASLPAPHHFLYHTAGCTTSLLAQTWMRFAACQFNVSHAYKREIWLLAYFVILILGRILRQSFKLLFGGFALLAHESPYSRPHSSRRPFFNGQQFPQPNLLGFPVFVSRTIPLRVRRVECPRTYMLCDTWRLEGSSRIRCQKIRGYPLDKRTR